MAIKKHKPTTPGRRFATWSDRAEVTRSEPEKSLTEGLSKSGGRNTHGRITSRHRGGGAKRRYRKIDFKRRKDGAPGGRPPVEGGWGAVARRGPRGARGTPEHKNVPTGRAGRNRHKGKRPQTRGTAMNPVDHPHGGGEGSTTPGRHPVTPWGVPTLGYRTRKKGKTSDKYIVRGRRRGKKR